MFIHNSEGEQEPIKNPILYIKVNNNIFNYVDKFEKILSLLTEPELPLFHQFDFNDEQCTITIENARLVIKDVFSHYYVPQHLRFGMDLPIFIRSIIPEMNEHFQDELNNIVETRFYMVKPKFFIIEQYKRRGQTVITRLRVNTNFNTISHNPNEI